jgi:dihydrolipoamide dehydrogenase
MEAEYDFVFVGGGYGANIASGYLARNGKKVAIVEKRGFVGGTCLFEGCIPSKALLNSSNKYYEAKNHFKKYGVNCGEVTLDFDVMMKKKEDLLAGMQNNIKNHKATQGIDVFKGTGRLLSKTEVEIDDEGQKKTIAGKNICFNVGGESSPLPGNIIPVDGNRVINSTHALSLKKLPKSMIVVGGGFIGLELGSHYSRLGVDVTVVEFLDRVLPMVDSEQSKTIKEILEKQGLKILVSTKVTAGKVLEDKVVATIEDAKGGNPRELEAEVLFVATGRRVLTRDLGLDKVGVEMDRLGRIIVNGKLQSNIENIYAIGDCSNQGPPLAHKAEDEAFAMVDQYLGKETHLNYTNIPTVVYVHPEVASCGKTEDALINEKVEYIKGISQFAGNSRAKCNDETEGFVKILADKNTRKILGVHMIGAVVGEMVMEAVVILEKELTVDLIGRVSHGHPGFGECFKSAVMNCMNAK